MTPDAGLDFPPGLQDEQDRLHRVPGRGDRLIAAKGQLG